MTTHQWDDLESSPIVGNFFLGPNMAVPGVLTLRGKNSSIQFWSQNERIEELASQHVIEGFSTNAQALTLIGFHYQTWRTFHCSLTGEMASLFMYPKYVIVGDSLLTPEEQTIEGVRFATDELSILFPPTEDFKFLSLKNSDKLKIEHILGLQDRNDTADAIHYAFFSAGEKAIFCTETPWGQISAIHNIRRCNPGRENDRIICEIIVDTRFATAVDLECALERIRSTLQFFALLIGRPQNITSLCVLKKTGHNKVETASVYDCIAPRYHRPENWESENRGLRSWPIVTFQDFPQVLSGWSQRLESWKSARTMFHSCFAKQRDYDIDRLIAAANMFDLLPLGALPKETAPKGALKKANEEADSIYRRLPDSPERAQMLGHISRLGKPTLKQKARFRAEIVGNSIDGLVGSEGVTSDQLYWIIGASVDCRNFFVHGSSKGNKFAQHIALVRFFADTLEFVFGVSDLIEAGWSISEWIQSPGGLGMHPFRDYLLRYPSNYALFQNVRQAKT